MAHLLRGWWYDVIVRYCSEEREGTGDVVISNDQWFIQVAMDEVAYFTEAALNLFIWPALNGSSEIDPDDLPQHSGVDPLRILLDI
jgi:hypothetical protein